MLLTRLSISSSANAPAAFNKPLPVLLRVLFFFTADFFTAANNANLHEDFITGDLKETYITKAFEEIGVRNEEL